jgi:glycosyltransferase involved in cell wall biosynthesis
VNVLHISESDAGGGAGKSARSLHDGLRNEGVRSRMLVGRPLTGDPDVRSVKRHSGWRALDRAAGTVTDALSLQYAFYPSSFGLVRDPWFRDADVLQLHNLHGSFFAFPALRLLARRKPTVWWMQDMWPLTGHVAYSYECERWRTGCGDCPHLHEYPGLRSDRTAALWRLKRWTYRPLGPTLVVSSRWLESVAADSPLLGHFERHLIPNGVDLDFFRPVPREEALERLGVAARFPTVLVFDGERRKGADLVPEILARAAAEGQQLSVLVAGRRSSWRVPAELEAVELGVIADEARLAAAYAAADVFLFPTLADNLPNAILECLACGTPLVSSDVGGVPDAVTHEESGFLAPVGDVDAFARGLAHVLGEPERLARMRAAARRRAEERFDVRRQTKSFLELYGHLLGTGTARAA